MAAEINHPARPATEHSTAATGNPVGLPTPSAAPSSSFATPVNVTGPPEPHADIIHIPSYSRWFTWNGIHDCEARFVPEFFDGRSPSKNPRTYKYYRNAIIRRFREIPCRKITFTDVRKTILGDVGSIRRVFDFLEAWGLINYNGTPSKPQLKWDDKETKAGGTATGQVGDVQAGSGVIDVSGPKKRICSGCKAPCTIACFSSDKHDMTLCGRCYVRGNYRVGLSSTEFKRVEISEEAKTDWSDKETLLLLEALMHYGDDWKKVSNHVSGRSVKECIARFIKLPFGEQFDGPPESIELDAESELENAEMPTKRMRLSPLADSSNPIMAQAAFLSKLVGVDVAEKAAQAALTALSNPEYRDASNGKQPSIMEEALNEATSQLDKEEEELEKAISGLASQAKEIEDKILHFEESDLQIERKRRHFQQLQTRLFVDQLTLLFQKTAAPKAEENAVEPMNESVGVSLPTEML